MVSPAESECRDTVASERCIAMHLRRAWVLGFGVWASSLRGFEFEVGSLENSGVLGSRYAPE